MLEAHPQTDTQDCKAAPGEIEKNLHSSDRFYTMGSWRAKRWVLSEIWLDLRLYLGFDPAWESTYDDEVVAVRPAFCSKHVYTFERVHKSHVLPPRSMVGQLPLEQPIGVRIPGGQPI